MSADNETERQTITVRTRQIEACMVAVGDIVVFGAEELMRHLVIQRVALVGGASAWSARMYWPNATTPMPNGTHEEHRFGGDLIVEVLA